MQIIEFYQEITNSHDSFTETMIFSIISVFIIICGFSWETRRIFLY